MKVKKEKKDKTETTKQNTEKKNDNCTNRLCGEVGTFLLMRLNVMMLNHDLSRDVVEFLLGKTSKSVQMN